MEEFQIIPGDSLKALQAMPTDAYQCVVTSPPYYRLRDYGVTGQMGLEASPEEYLDNLVRVFSEVRRVLRFDGCLWLNMGDKRHKEGPCSYYKPKDLMGLPWRLAIALQRDGWYLRQDVVWEKPTAMPESAPDRPGGSHEYLFLLSKSERYFYDKLAVMEQASANTHPRSCGANSRLKVDRDPAHEAFRKAVRMDTRTEGVATHRYLRSVWRIAAEPSRVAHYATYPRRLAARCIALGTSERGACIWCGSPWVRIIQRNTVGDWHPDPELKRQGVQRGDSAKWADDVQRQVRLGQKPHTGAGMGRRHVAIPPPQTLRWEPGCSCSLGGTEPCRLLDPFAGAGTTGLAAVALGRKFTGIELNPASVQIAMDRYRQQLARATSA